MPDNPEPGATTPDNSQTQDQDVTAPTDTQTTASTPDPQKPWTERLPEDMRQHPSLKNFKSEADLAKSWINAQKIIGMDKIPVPGKNSKPEAWEEVYNRLGRPSDPDSYKLPVPENMPEELKNEGEQKEFKATAHKLGLLPHQVAGLYEWWTQKNLSAVQNAQEQNTKTAQDAETALRQEWGMAYDQKLDLGKKVLKSFARQEDLEYIEKKGLGNDPVLIRIFANAGKRMSEDSLSGKPPVEFYSPEEARAKIKELEANPALYDKAHPEHDLIQQKRTALYNMLYPN